MILFLNGKAVDMPDGMTIASLLKAKGLNPEAVIIEYNLELIKRESWADIVLKENDRLEILCFIGGG